MIDCVNKYADFLVDRLTMDDLLWGYQLAVSAKNEKLKQYCERHISVRTKEIFESDQFLGCDRSVLESILEMNELACRESEVFDACLSWTEYALQQDGINGCEADYFKTELSDCFRLVRFGAMKAEEFAVITTLYKDLFSSDELIDILCSISVAGYNPIKFSRQPRTDLLDLNEWSKSQTLLCSAVGGGLKYATPSHSLRFSVNVEVLLGGLNFPPIYVYNDRFSSVVNCSFIIQVLEITDKSPNNKVLFTGKLKTGNNLTENPLTRAVLIHPEKLYEINVKRENYNKTLSSCVYPWEPEYKLDEQLTVTIHKDAANIETTRLISGLLFKRI